MHIINLYRNFECLIPELENKIFIEPFVGSGTIFINSSDSFNQYIINDYNKYIVYLWNGFKILTYLDYIKALCFVKQQFGNIKTDKNAYYAFRTWYNENVDYNVIDYSPYLYLLTNSVINSMLRFGPHGMNQGFGKCLYFFDEVTFNHIQKKLKNTQIFNVDYKELLKDVENTVYFIDPPYVNTSSPGYLKYFDIEEHKKLINILSSLKNSIYVYTDTVTEYNKKLNCNKYLIGTLNAIAKKNINANRQEYLFTNLEK